MYPLLTSPLGHTRIYQRLYEQHDFKGSAGTARRYVRKAKKCSGEVFFGLYRLRDDPRERNDLARLNRKEFNEWAAALKAHLQLGGQVTWQKP